MIEPEPDESLSVRKLVLETAKFNVVTAHSGAEGIELLTLFPKLSAVIVHSEMPDIPWKTLLQNLKKLSPKMTVVLLATHDGPRSEEADFRISSHSPEELLELMRELSVIQDRSSV